jgi:hypothetical protein
MKIFAKLISRRLYSISLITIIAVCSVCTCTESTEKEPEINRKEANVKIKIKVNNTTFTANLYDNKTTKALIARFPMTVMMTELNGNEKYYYFPENLPVKNTEQPDMIHTGDIMLYSSDCLVLFYKTFSTSYSYVRLGSIPDPSLLVSELGTGKITVTFSLGE